VLPATSECTVSKRVQQVQLQATISPSGGVEAPTSNATALANEPWPCIRHLPDTGVQAAPSEESMKTYFDHLYSEIDGHLKQDLMSRYPGKRASSDATFRVADRSTFKEEDGVEAGCLNFILGGDHAVNRWFALSHENWDEMEPGLMRYRDALADILVEVRSKCESLQLFHLMPCAPQSYTLALHMSIVSHYTSALHCT
jgi:hypothetical protein